MAINNTNNELFSEFPEVMDIKELQEALRIGQTKAYSLINSGAIPSKKIGKQYRILKCELIKFVTQN